MKFFSGRKLLLIGFILTLLIAIPVTVFFVNQSQQSATQTKSHAEVATILSFNPSTKTVSPNDTFSLDIMIDPQGINQVSYIKLVVNYDKTLFTPIASNGATCKLCANTAIFANAAVPVEGDGSITTTLSTAPPATVGTASKVATITFQVLSQAPSGAGNITFAGSQGYSAQPSDPDSQNILSSEPNAVITVAGPAPTPTPGPVTTNVPPTCTSLNVDRATSGNAPFSITFSASGSDSDGTLSKVLINFGDGSSQTIAQGNGIGTNTVTNASVAHTYYNPGLFTASAVFTDNQNGLSSSTNCSQSITVTAAGTGTGGTSGGTSGSTTGGTGTGSGATVVAIQPTAPPATRPILITGPGDTITKTLSVGVGLSILGAILLFAL